MCMTMCSMQGLCMRGINACLNADVCVGKYSYGYYYILHLIFVRYLIIFNIYACACVPVYLSM